MLGSRAAAAAILVAAFLVVGSPPAASAQSPTPSARELWEDYPLEQEPAPEAAAPPQGAEGRGVREPGPRGASTDGGGDFPWWVVVVAATAALIAALAWRRRLRGRAQAGVAGASTAIVPPDLPPAQPADEGPAPADGAMAHASVPRAEPEMPPPAGEPLPAPTADPLRPPDPRRAWTAEISWGERAGEWTFSVVAESAEAGPGIHIAESAPMNWPPNGPESIRSLRETVAELDAAMRASGWAAVPSRGAWYANRYAWAPASRFARGSNPRDRGARPRVPGADGSGGEAATITGRSDANTPTAAK